MKETLTLAALNQMESGPFVTRLHAIFEASPWIPERAWSQRPFADICALHTAMVAVVTRSSSAEQLALLRAHPQLAGKQAQTGTLTALSAREQMGVGLIDLRPHEQQEVQRLNDDYHDKFGFPFIIAVREHTRSGILAEWRRRLGNPVAEEQRTALEQVYIIARLRLDDLMAADPNPATGDKPMGKLSTHVLDTAAGRPAAGVRVDLSIRDGDNDYRRLKTVHTNEDGRTAEPLLDPTSIRPGEYELLFYVGEYFQASDSSLEDTAFLDQVPVRFAIRDAGQNYHVPLLISPWSYTTYRGS